MSALHDALKHPANRPGPLVRRLAGIVNPSADLHGLEDGGGVFCDFRRGLEEKNASLSVDMKPEGAVFKRFGGDSFEGGALAFVASCLNVGKGEAARLLIEWAGVVDTGPADRPAPTGKAQTGAAKLLARLDKLQPLEESDAVQRLRGWLKIEAGEETPEALEVARRGLTYALLSGVLTAYRFTGTVGTGKGPQKRVSLPGHILPGALAFEIRGPDGKTWAVKARNAGSKEDLEAAKTQRYVYVGKGQSTPAWCSPGVRDAVAHLITEGELNGVACAVMLEAAGYGGAVGVQGVASAEALPHVAHIKPGADVYLYADPDAAGDKARQTWAGLLHSQGAKVYQIGQDAALFNFKPDEASEYVRGADACDALGHVGKFNAPDSRTAYLGERLMKAIQNAPQWTPPQVEEGSGEGEAGDVWPSKREGFGLRAGVLCALSLRKNDEGEEYESVEALCNFAAHITAEVIEEDGTGDSSRVFEIEGQRADGQPMRPARVTVTAADFGGMNWAVREWGARAIVRNGQGKKDKAREAIQQLSNLRGFEERTVYTYTGWLAHPEHGPVYLTAGAVIGAQGGVSGVAVDLGAGLNAYALPDPAKAEAEEVRQAVRASLALLALAPDAVGVPIMGAVYRAPLGRADFGIWGTGETGRNKTAYMGLNMAHYGAGWSRHRLPEGWNSTANALEKTAHTVKDALFIIDDFKPGGSQTDVNRMHGNLARTLQGVADGAGRGRMGLDRKRQAGLFPRGLVMSSSETLPRGHSNRARVMMVNVERKLISSKALSDAYFAAEEQAGAGVYALALGAFVQFIAGHYDAVKVGRLTHRTFTRQLLARFEGAHGRTGPAAAEVAYGWAVWLTFAVGVGAITEVQAAAYWARVISALEDTAKAQGAHLRDADPVDAALSQLSVLLAQGRVYLEDAAKEDAAAPPEDVAPSLGWEAHAWATADGEGVTLRTRHSAVKLGYYSKAGGEEWAYFLPEALHEALQKAVGPAGASLPDMSTLHANMRDRLHPAGLMRCEVEKGGEGKPGRVRPYYKVTVRGSRTRFLALRLPLDLEGYDVGTVGTMGTDRGLDASSTVSGAVPTFNIFIDGMGTMGTPSISAPLSSFAADPLEDLEEYRESV